MRYSGVNSRERLASQGRKVKSTKGKKLSHYSMLDAAAAYTGASNAYSGTKT